MAEHQQAPRPAPGIDTDDVDAVTRAVLTASRLLVAVTTRSLAAVEEHVTLPQFRLLMVLSQHRDAKLVELAEWLAVNPSTAMRMLDRLIVAGLAERETNPDNRRETVLRVTPEGNRLVTEVTAGRRREIAAIVERLAPHQRTALVEALTAFTEAGEQDQGSGTYPLGWA